MADAPSQTQDPPKRAAQHAPAASSIALPPVDVRRKRPPLLSFLLRMETLRRASRVVSLLALDFAALYAAIFVALMVKAVLREGNWAWQASSVETGSTIAFAYLVMVLLFARSSMYSERAQRPGLPQDRHQPVPGHARRAGVRRRQRRAVLQLLHLLRHARVRDRHGRRRPQPLRARHGRAPARGRLPAPRRAGGLGQAHRGRGARAHRRGPRAGGDGRLHLAHAAPRQRPALARAHRRPARRAGRPPHPGGHHRRPRLPGGACGRAGRPVPPPRRHGADRAFDDGDPRPPRGVRPRRLGAAVRAAPAGVRRLRLLRQAQLRLLHLGAARAAAEPAAAGLRGGGVRHLARAGVLPLGTPRHRRRAVRVLQVPHDALGRRPAAGRPGVRERGHGPAVQDPRRSRA